VEAKYNAPIMRNVMSQYKIIIPPQRDAKTLLVALNSLCLSKSRTKMFALAREMTRRSITSDELMKEMLGAMELLEKNFVPKQ
jgi:hypothetical protein